MKNLIEKALAAHKAAEAKRYRDRMQKHHAACWKLARKLGVWMNTHLLVDFNRCTFFLPLQPNEDEELVVYASYEGLLFAADKEVDITVCNLEAGRLQRLSLEPAPGVTPLELLGSLIEEELTPTPPQDLLKATDLEFNEYDLDILQQLLGDDLYTGAMRLAMYQQGQAQ